MWVLASQAMVVVHVPSKGEAEGCAHSIGAHAVRRQTRFFVFMDDLPLGRG
jgi:hypothetical protein